ncbi:MAG: tetratricopeptide repeat protein [Candidatus Obscuribacterales bacterium]|nr:tetratricopeptide repeat protein [Candidatus Obscuribacterales bacterium]
MDLTLIVIIIWIGSTCLHEFGHAITAYIAGDKTVKEKGYLTLNPMVYFNSVTTLAIPLIVLLIGGIPLPGAAVYINHKQIKSKLWLSLVSFAGPLFTALVTVALAFALHAVNGMDGSMLSGQMKGTILTSLAFLIFLHIFVLVLNLLPLPPLDGYGIIEPWLPRQTQKTIRRHANIGFALLFFLFFFVDQFSIFMTKLSVTGSQLLGITHTEIFLGYDVFRANSLPLAVLLVVAWIVKSKFAGDVEKADRLLQAGKWQEAAVLYEQAIAGAKDKPNARVLLAAASCYLNIGQTERGLIHIERALLLDPKDTRAVTLKGVSQARLGQVDEALQTLSDLPDSESEELALAYQVKSGALIAKERFDEALVAIEKTLSISAQNADALYVKAQCLEELGRYNEALTAYQSLARLPEGHSRACLCRGLLLCALSRADEGLKEFEKYLPKEKEKRAVEMATLIKLINEKADLLHKDGKAPMAASLSEALGRL